MSDKQPIIEDTSVPRKRYSTLDKGFNGPISEEKTGKSYTVEEAVESLGLGWFQVKLFCICGFFMANDAMEIILLSVLSPVLRCEWMLTESRVAFITTVVFLGTFGGAQLWGSWSDKFGRKPVIRLCAVFIGYYGVLTSFSPSYFWMVTLRGFLGFFFGGAYQALTLLAEYLPSASRAKILTIFGSTWCVGCCFEIFLAYLVIPTLGWRALLLFSALPIALTVFLMEFMPESARYLLSAGRKDDALAVLQAAAKLNSAKLPDGDLVTTPAVPRGRIQDLFTSEFRVTTAGIWFLWFVTAFTYYGIVLAQSEILEFHSEGSCMTSSIHKSVSVRRLQEDSCHCNLLTREDYIQMLISTLGEFFTIPLNVFLIDTAGRKLTTSFNYLGAGVFFLLLNMCTSRLTETMFMFAIRAFTNGSFNTIATYTAEVYPTPIRSLGVGSGSAMTRIGAMTTPFVAQILLKRSLPSALTLYGGLSLVSAVVMLLLPIETKGRDLKADAAPVEKTPDES